MNAAREVEDPTNPNESWSPTRRTQSSLKPQQVRDHRRRRRAYLACTFCRVRKQRCDAKEPQCSNCEAQNAVCIYESTSKRAPVTQQYVQSLLRQIQELQSQVSTCVSVSSAHHAGLSRSNEEALNTRVEPLVPGKVRLCRGQFLTKSLRRN